MSIMTVAIMVTVTITSMMTIAVTSMVAVMAWRGQRGQGGALCR
jgi:hypothetical protein